ncbi:MAG: hypothetical protein N2316_09870 [Spirochaetes bacterium]|nr:hypothetical protein [Spirochaetota bacterium]
MKCCGEKGKVISRIYCVASYCARLLFNISVIFFFVSFAFGHTLTETIFTLPENDFEGIFSIDFVDAGEIFRKERILLGFGVTEEISVWYGVEYLHNQKSGQSTVGDSLIKIWFFCGKAAIINAWWGIATIIRIPLGPSMYVNENWRAVARGIHECAVGPVMQVSILSLFFHTNFFYVFRQAEGEDFYGGIRVHPLQGETYKSMFGFNPWYNGSFMERNRLKNDYASIAISAVSNQFFPLLIIAETYYSHRVYRITNENDVLSVEGAGINPFFVGIGAKYFFSAKTYMGISGYSSLEKNGSYIQHLFRIEAAAIF